MGRYDLHLLKIFHTTRDIKIYIPQIKKLKRTEIDHREGKWLMVYVILKYEISGTLSKVISLNLKYE